ncbi:MAG: winged helix-turn-helix domain-containing protein [Pseudorhodoplanes sp.]
MPRLARPSVAAPAGAVPLSKAAARRIWLHAQRLDSTMPFGDGPEATRTAVAHLGYVQIDTINVIERSHHHILYTRIPGYQRAHLHQAQSTDKSVFEYWTHALSYIPTDDIRYFLRDMRTYEAGAWYGAVKDEDVRKVLRLLRRNGPLTIRDIEDDVLVEKHHPWASRKPSKRALQLCFYRGMVTVAARNGMLKTYDLTDRHFGWMRRPRPASDRETTDYLLDRALRSQGIVSLDSVCHLDAPRKAAIHRAIAARVRRKTLVPVSIEDTLGIAHWARPETLESAFADGERVHILSPFDPLVIQRKRLALLFGYTHRFEAYIPKDKRKLGYFALPVLAGDAVVAAIDLKADREKRKLRLQKWTWIGAGSRRHKPAIEQELHRFEKFQLGT